MEKEPTERIKMIGEKMDKAKLISMGKEAQAGKIKLRKTDMGAKEYGR